MIDQRNELHDERVSALYRETRDVEPPARLDRHILKMAGVAVRSRPVSPIASLAAGGAMDRTVGAGGDRGIDRGRGPDGP
ncbi:MAG: hypothetical protein V9G98_07065 [Candidatus Competibacter sp.]